MAAKKSAKSTESSPAKETPAAKKTAKKAPAKKAAKKTATSAKEPAAAKKTAKKATRSASPGTSTALRSSTKPSPDSIARAAYLNYRRRVELGLPGDSHSDWLEAEQQINP